MAAAGAAAARDFRRWAACAVALDRLPEVGSEVYYFSEGHAQQWPSIVAPPADNTMVACTIESIECFTAGEQPYARISLRPGNHSEEPAADTRPDPDSFIYFAKNLSQSDFDRSTLQVPKLCAKNMFPALENGADAQALHIADLNGKPYDFEHKVTASRAHHLMGDWARFVKENGLRVDDTVVFIRGIDQDVLMESCRQHPLIYPLQEPFEELTQSYDLAAQGEAFTVTFHPGKGSGSPFVVPRGAVEEWVAKQWDAGMQVRMRPRDLVLDAKEDRGTLEVVTGTIRRVFPHSVWRNLEIDIDVPRRSIAHKNMWEVETIPDQAPAAAKRVQVSTELRPPAAAKRLKVSTELRL